MTSLIPTVQIKKTGDAERWLARARRIVWGSSKEVKVGFRAGPIAARAIWNEFGTSRGTPERPFMRTSMTKNYNKYRRILRTHAKSIIQGNMTKDQSLSLLGMEAAQDIQETIRSSMPPPNAPSTVRRKGSSSTLIDTGEMRQAVTYWIER